MAILLLSVIYAAFIGLGLPDSIFGAVWPAIYGEWQLPISYSNFVSVTTSVASLLSGVFSARLIHRFGTRGVTAVATVMAALSLFGYALSQNLLTLCLLSLPLGFGAGAVDAALNNYVALHFSARQMSFLHSFYGIGITLSPLLLSLVLGSGGSWRHSFLAIAILQGVIALATVLSFPLWTKIKRNSPSENDGEEPQNEILSLRQLLKQRGLPSVWLLFLLSVTVEMVCNVWGSTYLVEHFHISVEMAARLLLLYYAGMTLGRFFSGLVSPRLSSGRILRIGLGVLGGATLLLLLSGGSILLTGIGLFLVGFGNGPLYPNLMHLTPTLFGAARSQACMSSQVTAAYVAILLAPPVFGVLARWLGVSVFTPFLAVTLVLLLGAYLSLSHAIRKSGSAALS